MPKQARLTTYKHSKSTGMMIPDLARAHVVEAPYHDFEVVRRLFLLEQVACGIRAASVLISWTSSVRVGSLPHRMVIC